MPGEISIRNAHGRTRYSVQVPGTAVCCSDRATYEAFWGGVMPVSILGTKYYLLGVVVKGASHYPPSSPSSSPLRCPSSPCRWQPRRSRRAPPPPCPTCRDGRRRTTAPPQGRSD